MKLTGAEIFVECLKREGVKTLLRCREESFSRYSTYCISRRGWMLF